MLVFNLESKSKRFVSLCQEKKIRFVTFLDKSLFGQRLKEAFGNAKQAEIARKLGVSEAAVKNYVAGRVPDAEKLVLIRSLTNCSLDWLLTGEGNRSLNVEKVFDLEYSIDKNANWLDVIDEWYQFEGETMPDTMGASFMGGWQSFNRQQKIDAITDFKRFLDRIKDD